MAISIFDLFSIGIGPSSSHTVGPMRAAKDFLIRHQDRLKQIESLEIGLYGSLAYTGHGHGTDKGILMGLMGEDPETIDPDIIEKQFQSILMNEKIKLLNQHVISFSLKNNLLFHQGQSFDFHSNGMQFSAYDKNHQQIATDVYYSIGGGFIINEKDRHDLKNAEIKLTYPFKTADELLKLCEKHHLSICDIMIENEKFWRSENEIRKNLLNIADVMQESIKKGIQHEGILEGRLKVRRRAPALYQKLSERGAPDNQHPQVMKWLDCYAMAVNEENAAGGRVVTAPTNGAAGIIPAIIAYYKNFYPDSNEDGVINLLMTSGAIGMLYKFNASISGAEMGCQGEVGVACSMAAGGLAAALGGSIYQIENAAEIGMEHNLGMTCDPVDGLVQVPCIERNAMGAVKAVNAAQLALAEDGRHVVSLDMVINTMREIGTNMNSIYKETSKGGLAVNVTEC